MMAAAVLDDDRSVAAVAAEYRCAWHTVHDRVVAVADTALDDEPAPVTVLGIDETRRGKAKWETDPVTGARRWVDRWDTGLVDVTGDQGLLAQVNGRSSATVLDWLHARDEQWRQQITHVTIDLSSVYAKAVREALPHAELVVDRFHLVKKANEVVDAVRRRVTQTHRGRRGRKSDVEWINRRRLPRRRDPHRSAAHRTVHQAARRPERGDRRRLDRQGTATRPARVHRSRWARHEIRAALYRFYKFCAACSVPEVTALARTVETWQDPIVRAIQTGLSNA
ncbi:transposase, partial [Rhodococcus aetherivorans]